jgi:hypothetical protein
MPMPEAEDKRGFFAKIFIAMMIFTALVWIWTVAFIIAWPWEKSRTWKPEFRVVGVCAKNEPCGFAYDDLPNAKAEGLYISLIPGAPAGEVAEPHSWLKWTSDQGIIEAKASSWHFQTTIRYKVENETPVLIEYQDVDTRRALYYGIAAALFTIAGIYLRRLRR